MTIDFSGTIAAANVSQQLFPKAKPNQYVGYQIQNTSAAVLYFADDGTPAKTTSMQIPTGGTYTSPPGLQWPNGVQIMGGTLNQTFVAKLF